MEEFFVTRRDALLKKIVAEGKLSDPLVAALKASCEEWARSFA